MTDEQDKNKPEDKAAELFHWNWGETPSEVLYGLYHFIDGIAFEIPDNTRADIYEHVEDLKEEFSLESSIYGGVYEAAVDGFYADEMPFASISDINDFYKNFFPYNSKKIHEFFSGTDIFPIILEILGIIENLFRQAEEFFENYYFYCYYQGLDRELIIDKFGEGALKHYDPDRKLTEDDYESILEAVCEYLDYLQESNAQKRLLDLAARLKAYKDYFINPIDPKAIESQNTIVLNENQKKVLSYLSERPKLLQYQADVEAGTSISRKTVGTCLNRLMLFQLVKRPDNGKNGYEITQEGLNWLKENP
ncbi:MAG TPA: hypothetical protein PKB02_03740 [Anaerohalosphaeraceae bacterium]|nr:hypothetical protein [Anaerohalosphaeraceae bacterium]